MASTLQQPPILLKPFAENGDKNTIPETSTGDQRASLDEGFPPVTSIPLNEGGIPPERKDFNGLGNLTTKQYFYLQNGGRFTFNQDVSDAIGGYPQGAVLWYQEGTAGYEVISLINNNTYNFVVDSSYIDGVHWVRKDFADLTEVQVVVETYVNGTSWYRIWSDGFCEQGGELVGVTDYTVNFLQQFANTNYLITIGNYDYSSPDDGAYAAIQWRDKTTSSVRFQAAWNGTLYAATIDWRACGYIY